MKVEIIEADVRAGVAKHLATLAIAHPKIIEEVTFSVRREALKRLLDAEHDRQEQLLKECAAAAGNIRADHRPFASQERYQKANRALQRAEKRADALFKALEATYPPPARDGSKEGA